MNILTYMTHESFQWSLSKTGHNFYVMPASTRLQGWNTHVKPQPGNMIDISQQEAKDRKSDFDLMLTQNDAQYFSSDWWGSAHRLHVEHTTYPEPGMRPYWDCPTVFITDYNKKMWFGGPARQDVRVIKHGIDVAEWPLSGGNINSVISFVDNFRQRDWCCGYSYYTYLTRGMNSFVYGIGNESIINRDGLAVKPTRDYETAKKIMQHSMIYLNTSTHSPVPMALLEAMASAMLVVTAPTCEIPYYVDDRVNGLHLKYDGDDIKMISGLIEHYDDYVLMREEARKTIQDLCNIERFKDEWDSFFKVVSK